MKKFLLVLLFLSVLLITGCSKDDCIKGIKITSDNVKDYLNFSIQGYNIQDIDAKLVDGLFLQ